MGSVKRDIHKKERPFESVSISDPDTIAGLLHFRYKFDPCFMNDQDNYFDVAGNAQDVNGEAITLYISLDEAIKEANLSEIQSYVIEKIAEGYGFSEINGMSYSHAKSIFDTACRKIAEANYRLWKIYIHKQIGSEMKICDACKKELPKNNDFFRERNDSKDGFRRICRKCESLRRKN